MKHQTFLHKMFSAGLLPLILIGCGAGPASTPIPETSTSLPATMTPTLTITPPPTFTLTATFTATPVIESGIRLIVDEGNANGISVGRDDLMDLITVLPGEWFSEQQVKPRYEMHITPLATFIADCKYQPSGKLSRLRVDVDVSIVDLEQANNLIGKNHFKGYAPDYGQCPPFLRIGDKAVLGLPKPQEYKHWVIETILLNTELPAPPSGISSIVFSPDGKALILGGEDGVIKFLDTSTQQVSRVLTGHQDEILKLVISRDGMLLASASKDGTAIVWDIPTATQLNVYPLNIFFPTISFSADGKTLAVRSGDGTLWDTVVFWDVSRKNKAFGQTVLESFAFSPDGVTYATYVSKLDSRGLWIRDIATGKDIQSVDIRALITNIAYSPTGKIIAVAESDNQFAFEPMRVSILDGQTLKKNLTLENVGLIDDIVFSTEGNMLATQGQDFIILWDVSTGKQLHVFQDMRFTSLAFSPDGNTLATGSRGGDIRLWNLLTEEKITEFKNTFYLQKESK